MRSRFGPIRLIALHCGKFDYAEIELDRPLHLVGPNNVGKTSLISLLQFLYLDEQNKMRFSRDMPDTRKYYFPTVHSYALFECLTPSGYQTVGVRGCGPVRQYAFERFAYQGRFERTLFLDERNRVRPFDEIKIALSSKGYTNLTPAALRAALTGVGDSNRVLLGLVPMRTRDAYASFRELFCNILRLTHIRQDEMKRLLLALFAKRFHQPEGIDLARTYQDNFEKVKRDTRAVQMLKELVPDIERALQHYERRNVARARLPGLYAALLAEAQSVMNDLRAEEAALEQRKTDVEQELAEAEAQHQAEQDAVRDCTRTLTRLEDWLSETERLEAAFADYLPDWQAQRLTEVMRRSDELARRLGNVTQEPLERVQQRLLRHQVELNRVQARQAHLSQAVLPELQKSFAADELTELFRLLNPELLGLSVRGEEAGLQVQDRTRADSVLREIAKSIEGGVYHGPGVEVRVSALPPPLLERFGDADRIAAEIEELTGQVERDAQLCRDAEEADPLRREKQILEQERGAVLQRRDQYQVLEGRRGERSQMQQDRDGAAAAEQQHRTRLEAILEQITALRDERQALRGHQERMEQREQQLQAAFVGIEAPRAEWGDGASAPDPQWQGDLDDLASRYRHMCQDQQRQDDLLSETLGSIEQRTYSRYAGTDEEDTLQRLAEARDALPGQEEAAAELWKSIAVGIRENLQDMGNDLEILRTQITGINRRLGSLAVSNLKSIKLAIVENPAWTRRIRNIRLQDDMPLFAESGAAEQAFDEIGRMLSECPRVALGDLFSLSFAITMPDDEVRKYAHLDRIESNGTTIAIKVMVNLALLQYLLGNAEVQIPFYLDECSSLDSENLRVIVEGAAAMGFNAVLASPDAMDAAERLYFMNEQPNGRVTLHPDHAKVEWESDRPASLGDDHA